MIIKLYKTTSENNRVTKTLTNEVTLTGTLREECDILNPVILIESNSFIDSNYAYIAEFDRYYYINEVTIVNNKLYRLTMSIDVLMTYDSKIRNLSAIVKRQKNNWDRYLIDDRFYTDNYTRIQTFPIGDVAFNQESYILIGSGGHGDIT